MTPPYFASATGLNFEAKNSFTVSFHAEPSAFTPGGREYAQAGTDATHWQRAGAARRTRSSTSANLEIEPQAGSLVHIGMAGWTMECSHFFSGARRS